MIPQVSSIDETSLRSFPHFSTLNSKRSPRADFNHRLAEIRENLQNIKKNIKDSSFEVKLDSRVNKLGDQQVCLSAKQENKPDSRSNHKVRLCVIQGNIVFHFVPSGFGLGLKRIDNLLVYIYNFNFLCFALNLFHHEV